MAYSGEQYRSIKPKAPNSSRDENGELFPLIPPPGKVLNRYRPEKWEAWEIQYIRAWFAINPNPDISRREGWAMQLTEVQLMKQRSNLTNRDMQASITRQEFHEIKTQWQDQYERRLTNWFKNTRASLKRGGTGDLTDTPFSPATPVGVNQPRIAADNLFDERASTPTTYPASRFSADYESDDEYTPTPKMSYRHPDYDATPVASFSTQPQAPATSALDGLATIAVEALERRKHNPYPEYPESVIHGAYLLSNLKNQKR